MQEGGREGGRRLGEGKEKGPTGDWPAEERKLEWMDQGREGRRGGLTADKDRQTEGGMTKIRGINPAGVRQTRGAGEDRQKEKEKAEGGGQKEMGKQGQDRQTGSEWGKHETDRQMAGTRGCPGLPAFCCVYQLIELNCCQRCN